MRGIYNIYLCYSYILTINYNIAKLLLFYLTTVVNLADKRSPRSFLSPKIRERVLVAHSRLILRIFFLLFIKFNSLTIYARDTLLRVLKKREKKRKDASLRAFSVHVINYVLASRSLYFFVSRRPPFFSISLSYGIFLPVFRGYCDHPPLNGSAQQLLMLLYLLAFLPLLSFRLVGHDNYFSFFFFF